MNFLWVLNAGFAVNGRSLTRLCQRSSIPARSFRMVTVSNIPQQSVAFIRLVMLAVSRPQRPQQTHGRWFAHDRYDFALNVPVVVDTPAYPSSLLVQSNQTSFRRNQMELPGAKQVSEMTGVPVGTLHYWRHSDIGPASFTLGRRVVYRRDEVLHWIS